MENYLTYIPLALPGISPYLYRIFKLYSNRKTLTKEEAWNYAIGIYATLMKDSPKKSLPPELVNLIGEINSKLIEKSVVTWEVDFYDIKDQLTDKILDANYKSFLELIHTTKLARYEKLIIATSSILDIYRLFYNLFTPAKNHISLLNLTDDTKLEVNFEKSISNLTISDAAKKGDLKTIKLLIRKGYEIDSFAIYKAVSFTHYDIAEFLLKKGGKIHEQAIDGAVKKGDFRAVKFFVNHGAKIGCWAVATATSKGDFETVKFLVKHNGEIGNHTVTIAVNNDRYDIAAFLVENGGKVHYAECFMLQENLPELLNLLGNCSTYHD